MVRSASRAPLIAGLAAAALLAPAGALAQDDPGEWSSQAARSAFELCRMDAPDAAKVADHGEVAGWPTFVPYLEHPVGYKRLAGGESRRTLSVDDKTYFVEITVQSGQVTAAQPAAVSYFRCNVAADQPVNGSLEAYFRTEYGVPASKTDAATVWLVGPSAAPDAAASDDAALKALADGAVGAKLIRVELTHERGLDRAKLSMFQKVG